MIQHVQCWHMLTFTEIQAGTCSRDQISHMVTPGKNYLKHSREGHKSTGQASGDCLELVSLFPFYKPQRIMRFISTSLGILFGFAIFVNVVATTPGPDDELEGCPTTLIILYTDGNGIAFLLGCNTEHSPGARSQHHSECCRALFKLCGIG